jgi:hypothetical protein
VSDSLVGVGWEVYTEQIEKFGIKNLK